MKNLNVFAFADAPWWLALHGQRQSRRTGDGHGVADPVRHRFGQAPGGLTEGG